MNRILAVLSLSLMFVANAYATEEAAQSAPEKKEAVETKSEKKEATETKTEAAEKSAMMPERSANMKMLPGMRRMMACPNMQENVTININFNIRASSFTDAKKKYEDKMQQVNDFAKQQNIKKFNLQSMNYSINTQPNGYGSNDGVSDYQLNGNASYMMDSADNAFKLAEFLNDQKFQVSVNVNKYQNGGCNGMVME
jgi:uncharacterized protein YggE